MKKTTAFRSSLVILLVLFCLRSFTGVHGGNPKPKNVQVALRAKWSGTPLLLEACELLSREWRDLFWEFIEVWLQNEEDHTDTTYTARDCLKKVLRHGSSLLSDSLEPLFEFSLYLRSASPRLVLYRQLAEESLSSILLSQNSSSNLNSGLTGHTDSSESRKLDYLLVGVNLESPHGKCCWVDIGGALFFDVADLETWLHSPSKHNESVSQQPELFDFDHLYLDSNISSPVAILYGSLGTNCFKEFYQALVAAGKKGKVRYVMRPMLPSGCEKRVGACGGIGAGDAVNLGGYGVELALKNMEYKAMDELDSVRKSPGEYQSEVDSKKDELLSIENSLRDLCKELELKKEIRSVINLLEEDLKKDDISLDNDISDDDISEEEFVQFERELKALLGDDDIIEMEVASGDDEEGDEEEDDYGEDEDDEIERPVELKRWQLRRLASALKASRRKTSIKNLAAEFGLERSIVLELLRDPPPHLLMMCATLPDESEPREIVTPSELIVEVASEKTKEVASEKTKEVAEPQTKEKLTKQKKFV